MNGSRRCPKRPRRNHLLDVEAEQSGSEVTDNDEDLFGSDGDSGDTDDFINDDSSSDSDSDGDLDGPTTRRRTRSSNTHLAHIVADRSRGEGPSNHAPSSPTTRRRTRSSNTYPAHIVADRSRGEGPSNHAPTSHDASSDTSDSSSDPDSSRDSSPDIDMGSGDTLHNIVQMNVMAFEPLWRFRCTNRKERLVTEKLQSESFRLNLSTYKDLSFRAHQNVQGWVYVSGRQRDSELCTWIASVSTYVTRNRGSTHLNGPLICESVERGVDPSGSSVNSINPVSFNVHASSSSSTHPNSIRNRHPKSNTDFFHKWVRIRGGALNGEIGYALGTGRDTSSTERVKVLLVSRMSLSLPRPSASPSSSDSGSRKRKRRTPALTTTADSAALSPYRLFNPTEIRQIYGRDSVKPVRGHEHGYWFKDDRYQNGLRDRYQHGLLMRRFKVEQVQMVVLDEDEVSAALNANTIPFELYQLFSRSGHHDIPEEIRLFPRIREWVFDEGDRVRVRVQGRGEPGSSLSATGLIGTVLLSRPNGQLEVGFRGNENPNATNLVELQSLPWWKLVKVFEVGDYVTVTGGVNKGSSGWVVSATATGSSGSSRNARSSSSSSSLLASASALSSGERGSGVGSDVGGLGQDTVEVIEKTTPGSIVSPSGEFSGLKSFSVHSNLLRRVSVPFEFAYTLNTSGPSFSSLHSSNPLTLPGPLSRHVSGAGSLPVSSPETFSACTGATVIIVDPRCPDYGKRTTVLGVFRGYSPTTRRLWVKIAVEVSDDAGRGLVGMPARRIELDYFGVVDARTRKLLHEVYPATQPQNVTTPWKDVNVTIIQAHPEKGKHAVVKDVIPVALPSTSTATRNTRSNVDKGKSKAVEYPSGLKLIVELSGFTAGRTNARINLDYYGVATEDKSNGTLKWLHEVHKLRPAQVDFQPRSVLEARRYNKRIPEGDIPLPPMALSYTVSELTRMMGQTSATTVHMDHVPSAGTTSNVPSISPTSSHSSSSSSSTVSSFATAPPPSLSLSSSSSSSGSSLVPSSSSASSSSSSLSSPPSSFSPSSMYSLRPLPGRSPRNLSPLFSNSPCPPSSSVSSQSGSSRSRYNLRSSPTAAVTPPRSPSSVTNSSQSGSSPSRYNLRSPPTAVTPPRSPNSVTNTRASSVPSDSGVSLGSTEPDVSNHWIFNPRLREKKIAVIAHGGGFSNKAIFVVPKLHENEVQVIWEHYKKSRVIRPRFVYPRNPNPARYNGLSVVVGGEQRHIGKYVRRYNHTRSGMVYVSVMDHVEGRIDRPTGEVLFLEIDDLCVAFESHRDRELNEDVMVEQRSPYYRSHRSE